MSAPNESEPPILRNSRSAEIYDRARTVLPGGTGRNASTVAPFPIYMAEGRGAYTVDVDGVERLDLNNNYTSMIHGCGNPEIDRAVSEQLKRGTAFRSPPRRRWSWRRSCASGSSRCAS